MNPLLIFLLAFALFALTFLLIGLGILLKKRTPLKGSCHQSVDGTPSGCDTCHCQAANKKNLDDS